MATENQPVRGSSTAAGPVPPGPYLLDMPVRVTPRVVRPSVGAAWLSMLRHTRAAEWAALFAKLIGAALFATLVYTYCNVLIEACIRGIH